MIALLLSGWDKPMKKDPPQQRQQMEQQQNASASAGATSTSASSATNANSQNMSINDYSSVGVDVAFEGGDVNFDAAEIPDNTPNVNPGSLFPANPCHMVFNAGVSVAGFGAGGGKTYIDKNCAELEWIRMGYSIGMRDAAVHQWCNMGYGKTNPKCKNAQNYHKEMILLKLDNSELFDDYTEAVDRANMAEDEVEQLKENERERRVKAAIGK